MLARWYQERNQIINRAIKPLVYLAVIFLAYYLGKEASNGIAELVIIGVASLVGLTILLRKRELGLLALLILAISVPLGFGTGTQTDLNIAILFVLALLGIWLVNMALRRTVRVVSSSINLPLLAFSISATVSFVAGNLDWVSFASGASLAAQLGGWLLFVLSAGTALWVGNQINEIRWFRYLVVLLIGYGTLVVFGRLAAWMQGEGTAIMSFIPYGIVSALINPVLHAIEAVTINVTVTRGIGSLFYVWFMAAAAGQLLFNNYLRNRTRIFLVFLILMQVYAHWVFRSWASGWLPTYVTLVVIVWLRSWKWGLALSLAGVFIIAFYAPDLIAQLIAGDEYSITTRSAAWQIVLEQVFPLNPILGLGPANYHYYTAIYPILGWYVTFNSHNQYVDILAQTGILGMACFAWVMFTFGKIGWSLRKKVGSGFARGLLFACLAGMVGTLASGMLADWVIPFVYNITLEGFRSSVIGFMFMGAILSLEQMVKAGVKFE